MKTENAILLAAGLTGAFLTIAGAFSQAPVIGQGGAAPGPPFVYRGPHAYSGGRQPTFSGCGTAGSGFQEARIGGTDTAGALGLAHDYDPATFCDIFFADKWDEGAPSCVVIDDTNITNPTPNPLVQISIDQDGIRIKNGTPLTNIYWICVGYFGVNPPISKAR